MIGIPDEEAGELPKAFVVRKQGSQVTEQDIVDFVQGQFFILNMQFTLVNNANMEFVKCLEKKN